MPRPTLSTLRRPVPGAAVLVASCLFLFSEKPGAATENACNFPYLTVQTDPDGDQIGGGNGINTQEDIERIAIGEPFTSCTDKSITFIMKVANLSPLPVGAAWMVEFKVGAQSLYVEMNTATSQTPRFDYGEIQNLVVGVKNFQCARPTYGAPCPVTGSYQADGTIVLKLDTSSPLVLYQGAGSSTHVDVGRIGAVLSAIRGRTQLGGGVESSIGDTTIDITDPGTYTVAGNLACQGGGLPVAVLTANTASGSVPLTVSFDGSTSTHSTCTTLAKYTLDFGDGSTIVNQAGPLFSHDYISPGDYLAQLSVTDSAGQVSTNTAQVPISVTAATPPLSSVVSRKMHGDTTYDVNLPLEGTRGIECRTGASAGDHQLVFTFVNDLVNADAITASITSGTGSVSSSAPGADPKEYLVNLTGVANQQNIIVTLTGVQDSAGNSGPVVSPQMGVLIGDVNGSGRVDAADVSSVRQQTLQSITSDNFRDDLNTSGRIDAADVSVARQQTLTSLP